MKYAGQHGYGFNGTRLCAVSGQSSVESVSLYAEQASGVRTIIVHLAEHGVH